MSRFGITTALPECFILLDPRADGPVVGYYAGCPIPAAVVDYYGCRYTYAGVAPRRCNGAYDVQSLRLGEWIVEPGLIYRNEGRNEGKPGGLLKRLRRLNGRL
jgi:hypothetical protein